MITCTETTARPRSGFPILTAIARGLRNAMAVTVTVIRNRAAVKSLEHLDDYMLADIGLTRADLRAAAAPHTDPALSLAVKIHASTARDIQPRARGRRGDGAAPDVLWRAP